MDPARKRRLREQRVNGAIYQFLHKRSTRRGDDPIKTMKIAGGAGAKVYARAVLEGDDDPWGAAEAYQRNHRYKFGTDMGNSTRDVQAMAAGKPVKRPPSGSAPKKPPATRAERVTNTVYRQVHNTSIRRDGDPVKAMLTAGGRGAKVYAQAVMEGESDPRGAERAYKENARFRWAIDSGASIRDAQAMAAGKPVKPKAKAALWADPVADRHARRDARTKRVQDSVAESIHKDAFRRRIPFEEAMKIANSPEARLYAQARLEGEGDPGGSVRAYRTNPRFRSAIDRGASIRDAQAIAAGLPVKPRRREAPFWWPDAPSDEEVLIRRVKEMRRRDPAQYYRYKSAEWSVQAARRMKDPEGMKRGRVAMEEALARKAPTSYSMPVLQPTGVPYRNARNPALAARRLRINLMVANGFTKADAIERESKWGKDSVGESFAEREREFRRDSQDYQGHPESDIRSYTGGGQLPRPESARLGLPFLPQRTQRLADATRMQVGFLTDFLAGAPSELYDKRKSRAERLKWKREYLNQVGGATLKAVGLAIPAIEGFNEFLEAGPDIARLMAAKTNDEAWQIARKLAIEFVENRGNDKTKKAMGRNIADQFRPGRTGALDGILRGN